MDTALGSVSLASRAPTVRHKPLHDSNALSDYIQQSLNGRENSAHNSHAPKPPTSRRRQQQQQHQQRKHASSHAQERANGGKEPQVHTVSVLHMVEPDELIDADEYDDLVAELTSEFGKFGLLDALHLERLTGELVLTYREPAHANAVVMAKNGQLYGGRTLHVELKKTTIAPSLSAFSPVARPINAPEAIKKSKNRRRSKIKNAVMTATAAHKSTVVGAPETGGAVVIVSNMVDACEVEDDDEFADIAQEMTQKFEQYGEIVSFSILRVDPETMATTTTSQQQKEELPLIATERLHAGDIIIEYNRYEAAQDAIHAHDGKAYGGCIVRCWRPEATPSQQVGHSKELTVDGMLRVEELEDEDEVADLQNELETFFCSGKMGLETVVIDHATAQVTLRFDTMENAISAMQRLQHKQYGGRKLLVQMAATTTSSSSGCVPNGGVAVSTVEPKTNTTSTAPATGSSAVALSIPDAPCSDAMNELLKSFLPRLAALQERAHQQNPMHHKRSRRLVLGLHEVRRGLLSHKIRLLVVASDLDACDLLDGKLSEIISLAACEDVPLVRAFTRRKLGRILNKHARVSCVGVYSFDGANDQFREILQEHAKQKKKA